MTALLLALGLLPLALGFSFNTSTPTQCGQLTIQWDGGQEPFRFVLVPTIVVEGGKILNISIPTGQTAPYSHTFDLTAPAGLDFLATMTDATGFGSGGTTPVLTVGSSSNSSCLDSSLLYDFTFAIDPTENPSQCSSQRITWADNATDPVFLYGMIPSGSAFTVPLTSSDISSHARDWPVDIAPGTEFLLLMAGSGPAVTGGSTNLLRVGDGNGNCMSASSPSTGGGGSGTGNTTTTASGPQESISGVGGGSSGGTSNNDQTGANSSDSSSSGPNVGAIAGGVVGGVAFLVLLGILLCVFLRRRARAMARRGSDTDPVLKSYGLGGEKHARHESAARPVDLVAAERQTSDDSMGELGQRVGESEFQPSPFHMPPPVMPAAAAAGAGQGARASKGVNDLAASTTRESHDGVRSSMESGRNTGEHSVEASQVATAGHEKPATASPRGGGRPLPQAPGTPGETRFVQHEDSGEVVDLPPRYDQLRARNPDPV